MVTSIGVVGAGTIGTGVAHLFAAAEHPVVLVDRDDNALKGALTRIAHDIRFHPLVHPGFARADPSDVLARITVSTDLDACAPCDVVIENVTESWAAKQEVYRELDAVCRTDCLFGVNTSAISITRVAALTARPSLVVGTHFMNPAPLKPLVEVIRGFHTSDCTVERMRALIAGAGKDCVLVNDSPGFVTNRVMMLTVNEAVFLLQERVAAGAADIDRLFRDCFGHRMGPLETADLIGLDTVLFSLEVIHDSLADSKYRAAPLLRRMVDAGQLGRKSGRGFYDYSSA